MPFYFDPIRAKTKDDLPRVVAVLGAWGLTDDGTLYIHDGTEWIQIAEQEAGR